MTLEWVTESPPIAHNFEFIPPIRSERPVWDLNHPDHPTVPHGRHAREMAEARREAAMATIGSGEQGTPSARGAPTDGDGHIDGHTNGDGGGNGHAGGGNGSNTPGDGGS